MSMLDAVDWMALCEQPIPHIAATVIAYSAAVHLCRCAGGHPLLNPTLVAIASLAIAVKAAGLPYPTYLRGAAFVHFLLGPAVVLLAVPLFRKTALIRSSARLIGVGLAVGLPTGALSAVAIAWLLGAQAQTLLSLAPKSVTAGIAIGISERIGGAPALTAVLVIMTGVTGAVIGPAATWAAGVRDDRAIGFAMGVASHGIGTARAIQISDVAGAFAGLGMALNGVLTAVLVPLLILLAT